MVQTTELFCIFSLIFKCFSYTSTWSFSNPSLSVFYTIARRTKGETTKEIEKRGDKWFFFFFFGPVKRNKCKLKE